MRGLAPHDRPREKLVRTGVGALGDNELLAIVLGHGGPGHTALELANAVLGAVGGAIGFTRIRHDALEALPGVGVARAAQMLAAVELGRRTLLTRTAERPRFATPRDLALHLLPQFGASAVERSGVVLLDSRYGLLRTRLLTVGTSDASLIHPRDVLREVVVAGAAAFAVFHNHPTGDPSPSEDDKMITSRLCAAAVLLGVELVDHLILADSRYFSFLESGHLPRE